jgi:hypothetical protein
MAKQTINIGSGELAGNGESIRSAFSKINDNFDELYTLVPTDLSQLTDNQGLLANSFDGGSASSEYDEEQTIDGGQA